MGKNVLIQEQRQEQKLGQTISHQQMLQSALMELPITQLVDRINLEMNDNPALEIGGPNEGLDNTGFSDTADYSDSSETSEDFATQDEREQRQSALDAALESIGRDDDELPVYHGGSQIDEAR